MYNIYSFRNIKLCNTKYFLNNHFRINTKHITNVNELMLGHI